MPSPSLPCATSKRKREDVETIWLLWDSDVAREVIHPALGKVWTAVLAEALCVKPSTSSPPLVSVSRRMPRAFVVWSIPLLRWARSRGYAWNAHTCSAAARLGNLDVLKHLHENGCPWDEATCSKAALGGHLDVLKYAHENGCPWNERTCYCAALGGHMDVLKYARENRCPWDKEDCLQVALQVAGRFRKQNVIDWISQQTE